MSAHRNSTLLSPSRSRTSSQRSTLSRRASIPRTCRAPRRPSSTEKARLEAPQIHDRALAEGVSQMLTEDRRSDVPFRIDPIPIERVEVRCKPDPMVREREQIPPSTGTRYHRWRTAYSGRSAPEAKIEARPAARRASRARHPGTLSGGASQVARSRPLPSSTRRGRRARTPGGMRERPNRHAWKACVGQPTVGSNPTPSAVGSRIGWPTVRRQRSRPPRPAAGPIQPRCPRPKPAGERRSPPSSSPCCGAPRG